MLRVRPVVEALFDEFGLLPTASVIRSDRLLSEMHMIRFCYKRLLAVEGANINSQLTDRGRSRKWTRRDRGDAVGGRRAHADENAVQKAFEEWFVHGVLRLLLDAGAKLPTPMDFDWSIGAR